MEDQPVRRHAASRPITRAGSALPTQPARRAATTRGTWSGVGVDDNAGVNSV